MDLLKEIIAIAGAVIGILSAVVALGAKLLDLKNKAAKERGATAVQADSAVTSIPSVPVAPIDLEQIEMAKKLVKWPATAILITGLLGLLSNGLMTCFWLWFYFNSETGGYFDMPDRQGNRTTTVFIILMFFSPSVTSGIAIWAAANMIRLRSYWLSVAGSLAIMPGAFLCFLFGVPIGIWSIMVLFKPEVSSSFR
jgi:hypothetical protein